jgi:hypothetical protein
MMNLAYREEPESDIFLIDEEEEFSELNNNIAATQLGDETYGVTEEELEEPNFWINL